MYLDDIIIYCNSLVEHLVHLRKVLQTLKDEKLLVKFGKCDFGKSVLVYLGHVVGEGKLNIDPKKLRVIVEWPRPNNVINTKSFLAIVQYLRKFNSNFCSIASPLHDVIGKKSSFQWGKKQQSSFDSMKEKIMNAPILILRNV